jgi:hemolysin activation/secretion protein
MAGVMHLQMKPWRSYLTLALLTAMPLHGAEDFQRIGPKPVAAPVATEPNSTGSLKPTQGGQADEVVLSSVQALVFWPTPQSVNRGPLRATGIVLKDVKVPSETSFRSLVSPYLGRPLTRGKLSDLVTSIILYYRDHDHPVVDVIVPAQDITHGVLQLVLLEGKVGQVVVRGNRWFSSSEIADGVHLQPGDSISASALREDIDNLNQNPFRTTDVVYTPGEKIGDTNLVLQTKDRFPLRVYAGYEDSGDRETGFDRYLAGFNYGDLFGLGQQLNYQYTTSGNGDSLRAHAGSYLVPLPWGHTLTFFGSYVDTKGQIPPVIGLQGRSYQVSGRYTVPLPSFQIGRVNLREDVSAGFDYKYNKNSLEFGNAPAAGTLYAVDQFVLTYEMTLVDPFGQTTANEQLYISPGHWSGANNDAAFAGAHTGAVSDYVYNTLVLERLTKLPADWALVLRGTLQTSNANLAPSEQLGLGGYDSVRGYDEREVNTDDGYIFTTELRTPSLSLGAIFHHPEIRDQLQFLGFWDYGAGSNHAPLPGEPREIPLSSLGVGVRYAINTYLSVRYDYGFQLLRTGFDNDHGSRSDLGLVLSY